MQKTIVLTLSALGLTMAAATAALAHIPPSEHSAPEVMTASETGRDHALLRNRGSLSSNLMLLARAQPVPCPEEFCGD